MTYTALYSEMSRLLLVRALLRYRRMNKFSENGEYVAIIEPPSVHLLSPTRAK